MIATPTAQADEFGEWEETSRILEAAELLVTPAKVLAHAKGDPFGATRYKF